MVVSSPKKVVCPTYKKTHAFEQVVTRMFLLSTSISIVAIITTVIIKFYNCQHNDFTHTFTYATCSNLIQSPFFRNSKGWFSSANRVVHYC